MGRSCGVDTPINETRPVSDPGTGTKGTSRLRHLREVPIKANVGFCPIAIATPGWPVRAVIRVGDVRSDLLQRPLRRSCALAKHHLSAQARL